MEQLPMTTDRLYNTGIQLISPPPEETLRRSSARHSPQKHHHSQSSPALSNVKRKRSHLPPTAVTVNTGDSTAADPQPLATPNPRSRKQPKHQPGTPSQDVPMHSPTRSKSHPPESLSPYRSPSKLSKRALSAVLQSPHAQNPNADYIPPIPHDAVSSEDPKSLRSVLSSRSSRRSATPIPPYEPPTDIFTPPKEVFVTPITATIKVSKSSKRKGTTTTSKKKKRSTPPLVVKLEMPEIDLTAPMPPPSPGDDPLLLSSSQEPSSTPTRPRTTRLSRTSLSEADVLPVAAASTSAPTRRTVSPPVFTKLRFDDLPPSSPPLGENSDQPPSTVFGGDNDDSSIDLDSTPVHIPLFGDPHDNGWSDSEGDELPVIGHHADTAEQEGEGEYTGKFKEVLVKTKADPPSSTTKGRMDEWGNPKSPFPLSLEKKPTLVLVREEEEEQEDEKEKEAEPMSGVESDREVDPFDFSSIQDPLPAMSVDPSSRGEDLADPDVDVTVPLEDAERGSTGSDVHIEEDATAEPEVEHDSSVEDAFRRMGNEPIVEDVVGDSSTEDVVQEASSEDVQDDILDDIPLPPTSEEHSPIEQPEAERMDTVASAVPDEEDTSTSDDDEPELVKITSTDPRAAARAAAILKQHNYDCFTKVELKRRHSDALRRRSGSPSESLHREAILRNVSAAGIRKDDGARRRRTFGSGVGMGVRGDAVFIPGSPVTTLPELLKEAEAEVSMEHDGGNSMGGMTAMNVAIAGEGMASPNPFVVRDRVLGGENVSLFKTPLPGRRTGSLSPFVAPLGMALTPKVPMTPGEMCYDPLSGERMWTKEEWKRLDACFTDERLEVGVRLVEQGLGGVGEDGLADVEKVGVEDVVQRFVEWMGGDEAVEGYGPAWSMENLLKRTRALRKKQRSGNVAPPTMVPPDSTTSMQLQSPAPPFNFNFDRRSASVEVPDFTPIRQRPILPKRQWTSVVVPQEFSSTPFPVRQDVKPVPATLLAPRYSHLLEEAVKISKDLPVVPTEGEAHESDIGLEEPPSEDSPTTLVEESETIAVVESPEPEPDLELEPEGQTIGKRVKGLIFSYLPTLKKPTAGATQKDLKRTRHPGLPLPPQDVLSKPRGPVVTPAREPIPKIIPPKELVQLQQAPPIEPPASKIPKLVPPKELVELHPVTPKVTNDEKKAARPRRSSGASVKDLIKGFEDMQSQQVEADVPPKKGELKRMKSVGEWRKGLNGPGAAKAGGDGKVAWKP